MRHVALLLAVIAALTIAAPAAAWTPPRPASIGDQKWTCGTVRYPSGDVDRWCYKANTLRLATHCKAYVEGSLEDPATWTVTRVVCPRDTPQRVNLALGR